MLDKLKTETRNEKSNQLDKMSTLDALQLMNEEDRKIPDVIQDQIENINQAVQLVIDSFNKGGRLLYVGAGTSGRLGILDAVECVPTFSSPPDMVQGLIAGGLKAFTKAVEGAEDSEELAVEDLEQIKLTENDTVIAIAASGRTPYAIGGLKYASQIGAHTVSITCNKKSEMSTYAQVAIELDTGAEVLTGSTRLKAGTAQKIVLNMISTVSMVGIGKAYENLMVDLQATNLKLVERSKRIIMEATQADYETANIYFEKSGQHVKTAIIMILLQCSKEEAKARIEETNGFVREAIEQ